MPDIERSSDYNEEPVAVTLTRLQWRMILAAASSYDSRVGGACLDAIRAAVGNVL